MCWPPKFIKLYTQGWCWSNYDSLLGCFHLMNLNILILFYLSRFDVCVAGCIALKRWVTVQHSAPSDPLVGQKSTFSSFPVCRSKYWLIYFLSTKTLSLIQVYLVYSTDSTVNTVVYKKKIGIVWNVLTFLHDWKQIESVYYFINSYKYVVNSIVIGFQYRCT